MRVLVSNDDGVDATGIGVLADHLSTVAEVSVVAPHRDYSGASSSLTLDGPIRATRMDNGYYRVVGTPTDCVHLGLSSLLAEEPDIVVSGINNSANLGDDVIYSGTVSAAIEGRFLGLPAIAVSLVSQNSQGVHYESAARVVLMLIRHLLRDPMPADTILNVNVPDRDWHDISGFEVTRLGCRRRAEPCIAQTDPRGRPMWWIGLPGEADDAGPGTDFNAVDRGFISVTPIHVDLTCFRAIDKISRWMKPLNEDMTTAGR